MGEEKNNMYVLLLVAWSLEPWIKGLPLSPDGHQKPATFTNKMGGSTKFNKWERRDDILDILNTNYQKYISPHTSNSQKIVAEKGDSATSAHYWREKDIACLAQIQTAPGPAVTLPNNTTSRATKQGNIPINASLSSCATNVVMIPFQIRIANIIRVSLWW